MKKKSTLEFWSIIGGLFSSREGLHLFIKLFECFSRFFWLYLILLWLWIFLHWCMNNPKTRFQRRRRIRVYDEPLVLENSSISVHSKQWWWLLVEAKKLHGWEHWKLNMGNENWNCFFTHPKYLTHNTTIGIEDNVLSFYLHLFLTLTFHLCFLISVLVFTECFLGEI